MNKQEWDNELYFQLKDIKASEKEKIIDYYSEMFADRIESGMSEQEILNEFGNPYEVAQKIFAENRDNIIAKKEKPYQTEIGGYEFNNQTQSNSNNNYNAHRQENVNNNYNTFTQEQIDKNKEQYYNDRGQRQYQNVFKACKNNYGSYNGDETFDPNSAEAKRTKILQTVLYVVLMIGIVVAACAVGGCILAIGAVGIAFLGSGFMVIGVSIASAIAVGFTWSTVACIGVGGLIFGIGLILIPTFKNCIMLLIKGLKKFYDQIMDGEIRMPRTSNGGER